MNQRIPLSLLAVASVIGLMVAAAVLIPQTAHALYCYTYPKDAAYSQACGATSDECKNLRDAQIANGTKDVSECALD